MALIMVIEQRGNLQNRFVGKQKQLFGFLRTRSLNKIYEARTRFPFKLLGKIFGAKREICK